MNPNQLEKFSQPPSLRHLKRLTTKDGLIQHADYEVPDPSFGYSIDDNARALIACLWYYSIFHDQAILHLAEIYFSYIKRVEKEGGSFHNFLTFLEKTLEPEGSEDSIGRAVWALGETIAAHPDMEVKQVASAIMERADLDKHLEHPHLRTKAYILLGLLAAGKVDLARRWADRLVEIYNQNRSDNWQWFEYGLFYANGILPYALARAAKTLGEPKYLQIAEESLSWLDQVSRENSIPAPIGQDGWYIQGRTKALYDQQPLEAADMVLAATAVYQSNQDKHYLNMAVEWQDWYEGNNLQKQSLINEVSGGIYDALTPNGVNKNQGAESIVTYLLAHLSLASIAYER